MSRDILQIIIAEATAKRDRLLESYILELARPKITGEVTPGKLRWRGVRLCTQDNWTWVEQRGEQLGAKVRIAIPNI